MVCRTRIQERIRSRSLASPLRRLRVQPCTSSTPSPSPSGRIVLSSSPFVPSVVECKVIGARVARVSLRHGQAIDLSPSPFAPPCFVSRSGTSLPYLVLWPAFHRRLSAGTTTGTEPLCGARAFPPSPVSPSTSLSPTLLRTSTRASAPLFFRPAPPHRVAVFQRPRSEVSPGLTSAAAVR